MEKEIWKPIENYGDLYHVSNLGRIKSLDKIIIRSDDRKVFKKESILKGGIDTSGYRCVILTRNKKHKTFNIHKLVAIAFLNHIPCGFKSVVNHINFNRLDNRVTNLEIITTRENNNQKHLESRSKYVGVCWSSDKKKWISRIYINNKNIHLGYFDSEIEAGLFYDNALKAHNNNKEIIIKKKEQSSKYKGVSRDRTNNKWLAAIYINKKLKHLGRFNTEEESHNVYQNNLNKKYDKKRKFEPNAQYS